jgi:hypothetical protein
MVNLPGRDRRRRVLKDEVLSASSNYTNLRATTGTSATSDAPRYSDAAAVENHPQITDFVPRRYATIAMLIALGAIFTAALAAMDYFAETIAASAGIRSTVAFDLTADGSLAAWLAAVVLLVTSAACLITYSIRRHRIDDFRGRYRVWFMAAIACLVMSANCVAGMHQVVADALRHLTGWTALRDGAAWWLLLAGLPFGWILLRTLIDMRECRVAVILLVAATMCYVTSAVAYLGLVPITDPRTQTIAVGATLLLGYWLSLASVVSYARFVVLDAQGLIVVRRRSVKPTAKAPTAKTTPATTAAPTTKPATTIFSAAGISRATLQPAKTPADASRWVDGSRPERERYDDDEDDDSPGGTRKLSKSDRKRLRKLKAQGRAA